nr:MAG TPA: hypothetical protein [Caudoviricetes sp.]
MPRVKDLTTKQKLESELLERALSKTVTVVTKKYKYQKTATGNKKTLAEEVVTEKFIQGDKNILMALAKENGLVVDVKEEINKHKLDELQSKDDLDGLGEFL